MDCVAESLTKQRTVTVHDIQKLEHRASPYSRRRGRCTEGEGHRATAEFIE